MNATYSGWRGSVMVAINELLAWDQYFAVGGALRHIDFDPTAGTLNCADFPASVSTAPTQSMEISLYPAYNAISKMLFSDEELRGDIMGIGGTSQWPATLFRGIDQWGRALRLPADRSHRRLHRRLRPRRRHQHRRPGTHADLPAPQRGAQRAELPAARALSQGAAGFGRRRQVPRRALRRDLLHPAQHRPHHPGHAVVGQRDADVDRHDGGLPLHHQRLPVHPRQRHPGADGGAPPDRRPFAGDRPTRAPGAQAGETSTRTRRTSTRCAGPAAAASATPCGAIPPRSSTTLLHRNVTPEAARAIFGAVLGSDETTVDCRGDRAQPRPPSRAERLDRLTNGRDAATRARRPSPAPRDRFPRRAQGRGRCLLGLRRLRGRRSARSIPNYKDACLQDVRPVSDSNPLIGDPSLFRGRPGRVPPLLLPPALRRADRERDRRRHRSDPAGISR